MPAGVRRQRAVSNGLPASGRSSLSRASQSARSSSHFWQESARTLLPLTVLFSRRPVSVRASSSSQPCWRQAAFSARRAARMASTGVQSAGPAGSRPKSGKARRPSSAGLAAMACKGSRRARGSG